MINRFSLLQRLSYTLAFSLAFGLVVSNPALARDRWQDHTLFEVNKLAPHASFFGYESEPLALLDEMDRSQLYVALNGRWRFHLAKNPDATPKEFAAPEFDASHWGSIQVPAISRLRATATPSTSTSAIPSTLSGPMHQMITTPQASTARPLPCPPIGSRNRCLST